MKLNEIDFSRNNPLQQAAAFVQSSESRDAFPLRYATVSAHGSIDVACSVNLNGSRIKELPFRFGTIDGSFTCNNSSLTTMKNFPTRVEDNVSIALCLSLTSLEGLPRIIGGNLFMGSSGITSLENTYDIFSNLRFINKGLIYISTREIKKGGISLIFAQQCKTIQDGSGRTEPFEIIQKYLGRPNDIYECQAELIEAGFEEHAVL